MSRNYGLPFRKQDNEPKTVRDAYGYILADCQTAEDADRIIAALNSTPSAPVTVPNELLRKAGQVIAWHCFGDCRAFSNEAIPDPSDVVEQIKSLLAAAQEAYKNLEAAPVTGEPDLVAAEKLVPYEIRYFHSKEIAKSLGYKVIASYKKIPEEGGK